MTLNEWILAGRKSEDLLNELFAKDWGISVPCYLLNNGISREGGICELFSHVQGVIIIGYFALAHGPYIKLAALLSCECRHLMHSHQIK